MSDRDDIELVQPDQAQEGLDGRGRRRPNGPRRRRCGSGCATAWSTPALLGPPASLFAKAAGLKVIDIEPLPMIQFTTVSSSLGFVEKHPDIVERFLKGLIEGIHFFKTRPEEAIKIIQERCTKHGQMNQEQATITHQSLAGILEPKLYPKMQAIANVYEEAIRQDKDAKKINPMELWDLHHLRRLDDMGFVDGLYGRRNMAAGMVHDHHEHGQAHDEISKEMEAKATTTDAMVSFECDNEDCTLTHPHTH